MQPRTALFSLSRRAAIPRAKYVPRLPLTQHRAPVRPLHLRASSVLRSLEHNDDLNSSVKPQQRAKPHAPRPTEEKQPEYELTFTCKPCGVRSAHRITKQGYHHGSVLIACPGCKNRHIISDHLRIFTDTGMTVEDLMRKRGQLVKKGTLGQDSDIEFWEDGTQTKRSQPGTDAKESS